MLGGGVVGLAPPPGILRGSGTEGDVGFGVGLGVDIITTPFSFAVSGRLLFHIFGKEYHNPASFLSDDEIPLVAARGIFYVCAHAE